MVLVLVILQLDDISTSFYKYGYFNLTGTYFQISLYIDNIC